MDAVNNDLFDFVTTSEEPVCYYIGSTIGGYYRIFFNYTEFMKSVDNYDTVVLMNDLGIKLRSYNIIWDYGKDDFYFKLVTE